MPLACPQLGTRPTTQPCALTGNQTRDTWVHRPALSPLSHTSKGGSFIFKCFKKLKMAISVVSIQLYQLRLALDDCWDPQWPRLQLSATAAKAAGDHRISSSPRGDVVVEEMPLVARFSLQVPVERCWSQGLEGQCPQCESSSRFWLVILQGR